MSILADITVAILIKASVFRMFTSFSAPLSKILMSARFYLRHVVRIPTGVSCHVFWEKILENIVSYHRNVSNIRPQKLLGAQMP